MTFLNTRRTALVVVALLGFSALASSQFRLFLIAASRALLGAVDDVPNTSTVPPRADVAGPADFADSWTAKDRSIRHSAPDLTIKTSVGGVSLTRYFNSSPPAEPDFPTDLVPLPPSPTIPAAPFGTSSYFGATPLPVWTHSFYSFVTTRINYDDYLPRVKIPYAMVRHPSGDVNTYSIAMDPPVTTGWETDRNESSDVRLMSTDAGFVVRKPSDGRYYYEYLGVGDGKLVNNIHQARYSSLNRYYLTRVEDEEYATSSGTARVRYSISYRAAQECADAGVPAVYVDKVTMADGQVLRFVYGLQGTSCNLSRVDFQPGPLSDAGTAVRYSYSAGSLSGVDILDPADAGTVLNNLSYSTGTAWEASADGRRFLHYDLLNAATARTDVAGDVVDAWTWLWARDGGSTTGPCATTQCVGPVFETADALGGSGSGIATTVDHSVLGTYGPDGAFPARTFLVQDDCVAGECAGVASLVRTWTVIGAANGSGGYAYTQTRSAQDSRGYFTNYGWGVSSVAFQDGSTLPELRWVARGSGVEGSNVGQLYAAYTYEYGGTARSPATYDQLVRTESSGSVLSSGTNVTTTYVHDLASSQLKSKIVSGYTLLRGTPSTPATTPTPRYVGTFYFRSHVCKGDAADPLGRIVEVHGPCEVSSPTATDCPVGSAYSNMPVKQYFYNALGSGSGAGLLSQTSVQVTNGGAGACQDGPGVKSLVTQYQNYDGRGHPQTIVGPDGVQTTLVYKGDFLKSQTVGSPGLITTYSYEGARLTATGNPDGTFDVVCYHDGLTGCTGTLREKPQWKARATDQAGTNWTAKTRYTWRRGRLITEQEYGCRSGTGICTDGSGSSIELRRVLRHEADPYGRGTYEQVGDENVAASPASGAWFAASLYDGEGNETAIGFPFLQHSRLCGGVGDAAFGHAFGGSSCARLDYDAVNRLVALTPVLGAQVNVSYDGLGRVKTITYGANQVSYTYDDFGNLVRVRAPWTKGSNGQPDVHAYEYDGHGWMVYKQTPAMRVATPTEWLEYVYDASGRQLSVIHKGGTAPSGGETLYGFDYDVTSASFTCGLTTGPYVTGRVARRVDSFGSTWFKYDQYGNVLAEVRARDPGYPANLSYGCGAASMPNFAANLCTTGVVVDDNHPSTFYNYDSAGRLNAMQYPHGRVVRFAYDAMSRVTTVKADLNVSGTCAQKTLLSNIQYDPSGAVRGYQISSPTASANAAVEYFPSNDGPACGTTRPSAVDTTGRIGALLVSTGINGSGTGDIYQGRYGYTADQLVTEAQCLLPTSADKPRMVYYQAPSGSQPERNGYDAALRLVHANRPTTAGNKFSDLGGAIGRRDYGYDSLGNRTSATTDCWQFSGTYGDASRPDQLTAYTSINAVPNPLVPPATSPACDASPYATRSFTYDADGRVASAKTATDSSGSPAIDLEFSAALDGHAAIGAVYKSISVNGFTYEYWYDAEGRRRLKQYPQAGKDEFFYGLGNLLEDRGLTQTGVPGSIDSHPLDEYIWLGGRPVVLIRSMLDSTWKRGNDSPGATCTRNYETSACGVYFVASDYLPKPVLMLDSNLHVVNAADYDPFGHVNRVTSLGHTPHPYSAVGKSVLGYFSQPGTFTPPTPPYTPRTKVNLRALFSMVDTSGSGDYAYLADDQNAQLNKFTGGLSASLFGVPTGVRMSDWVPVPTNGHARVVFHAGAGSSTYKGVALAGYEYRRYDATAGTQPTWLPIRLPGQYHDAETDLFQNWNRFYDPNSGRYLEPDSVWLYPEKLIPVAKSGHAIPIYTYVGGNPLTGTDPAGLLEPMYNDDGTVTIVEDGGNMFQAIADAPADALTEANKTLAVLAANVASVMTGLGLPSVVADVLGVVADGTVLVDAMSKQDLAGMGDQLPTDARGNYKPVPGAEGEHTRIGTREASDGSGPYKQAVTFDAQGNGTQRIDFTDHGRSDHTNPHAHSLGQSSTGDFRIGPARTLR